MGDFAIGRCEGVVGDVGRILGGAEEIRVVEGDEYNVLVGTDSRFFDAVQWIGYVGVRDATTTSMPEQVPGDPELPPWLEMVELRYGVAPQCWGRGVARRAAEVVMQWAVSERGARRFIAETKRDNVRSGRVLEKLGFRLSETNYWKEPSEVEWERFPR